MEIIFQEIRKFKFCFLKIIFQNSDEKKCFKLVETKKVLVCLKHIPDITFTLNIHDMFAMYIRWNIYTNQMKVLKKLYFMKYKNKKSKDFMQSCFPFFVYFKCCSDFLLYFYKCSTSMAFTLHWPLTLILYRCKFRSI